MSESLNLTFSRAEGFEIAGEVSNAEYAAIYCEHIVPSTEITDVFAKVTAPVKGAKPATTAASGDSSEYSLLL